MPDSSLAALTSILKNSLFGPPTSTAPSLLPSLPTNCTVMRFRGENLFFDSWRQVSDHMAPRRTLMTDVSWLLICIWRTCSASAKVLSLLKRKSLNDSHKSAIIIRIMLKITLKRKIDNRFIHSINIKLL